MTDRYGDTWEDADVEYMPPPPRPIPHSGFKPVSQIRVPDTLRDENGNVPLSERARADIAAAREHLGAVARAHLEVPTEPTPIPPPPNRPKEPPE